LIATSSSGTSGDDIAGADGIVVSDENRGVSDDDIGGLGGSGNRNRWSSGVDDETTFEFTGCITDSIGGSDSDVTTCGDGIGTVDGGGVCLSTSKICDKTTRSRGSGNS
jgi:hypothetical protein